MTGRGSARHTSQSFSDQEAISSLGAWIAHTRRAMPDLKANDKWPNIDGYIIMTDAVGHPLGTLKAQVKTLNKADAKSKRFRFTTNDSREKFIRYCEECQELPILLIGVDLDTQVAYWRRIDKHYLAGLGTSGKINFPPTNVISLNETGFIDEWQNIVEVENEKARIAEAFTPQELERITHAGTRILGKEDDNFRAIHLFLDKLNSPLDTTFSIIKKVFYLNCWKVGFAYFDYRADAVGYILYPVPFARNDTLIKEVDESLFEEFQHLGLGYAVHYGNPIATNPAGEVEKILRRKVDILITEKLFIHTGSEALAREYVFAFIDQYYEQMGMTQGLDEYSLREIDEGFNVYLPLWLDEAFNFMKTNNRNGFISRLNTGRIQYYDLGWWHEMTRDELNATRTKVQERIRDKDRIPVLPVHARVLSPRVCAELLDSLREHGLQKIRRLYSPRNLRAGALSQTLTPEQVAANLEIFFEYFLDTYATFIEHNFPALKERLSFMETADKLIFVYDLQHTSLKPVYTMYFLKSTAGNVEKSVDVLSREQFGPDNGRWRGPISLAGHDYAIMGVRQGHLRFIYANTPMFDVAYETLKDKLADVDYTT